MNTRIQRQGSTFIIRIPSEVAAQAGLQHNTEVALTWQDGSIRVTPLQSRSYTLEGLIGGITDENRHDEWDMGADVGREGVD